jgi:hypothetical protein
VLRKKATKPMSARHVGSSARLPLTRLTLHCPPLTASRVLIPLRSVQVQKKGCLGGLINHLPPEKRGNSQSTHIPIVKSRGCGTQPISASPVYSPRLPMQKDPTQISLALACSRGQRWDPFLLVVFGCLFVPRTSAQGTRSRTQFGSLPPPQKMEAKSGTPRKKGRALAPFPANKSGAIEARMHSVHARSPHVVKDISDTVFGEFPIQKYGTHICHHVVPSRF